MDIESNIHTTFLDFSTDQRHEWSGHNTVTSGCLSFLRDMLASETRSVTAGAETLISGLPRPPTYIAVGSGFNGGSWVTGRYMTSLPGEFLRATITSGGVAGQAVTLYAFLASGAGAGPTSHGMPIGAYGIYAGEATGVSWPTGSGVLLAIYRDPTQQNKNFSNTLSIHWTLTLSGKL